jgi:hypothetical protein
VCSAPCHRGCARRSCDAEAVLPVTLAGKEVFEISRGNDQGGQVYAVVFALADGTQRRRTFAKCCPLPMPRRRSASTASTPGPDT